MEVRLTLSGVFTGKERCVWLVDLGSSDVCPLHPLVVGLILRSCPMAGVK